MSDVFAPAIPPQEDPSATVRNRVRRTQFGDGYAQVVTDGLNVRVQRWPLSYKGTDAEINVIRAFVDSHVGISFLWTPPLGVQGRYLFTEEYGLVPSSAGWATLNVTLEQVYFP